MSVPFDRGGELGTEHRILGLLYAGLALAALLSGCSATKQTRQLVTPADFSMLNKSTYLKVHMHTGDVYILSPWSVDSIGGDVAGTGVRLDINRDTIASGDFHISIDSVAIFETNSTRVSAAVAALSIVTAASVAMTIYCISNPKACFGSCPTFYTTDARGEMLQAEGFSSSVAPSLEATDIDALWRADPVNREFHLQMTNEALETHVVRNADLLIARRPPGGRVLVTRDGAFWAVEELAEPVSCTDAYGDCLHSVLQYDANERRSLTDSQYLGTREYIDVAFDVGLNGQYGLIIASRQSLLSTYLFYQTLAYMGASVSEWYAWLERQGTSSRESASPIGTALGVIEVQQRTESGDWTTAGVAGETGPLATNIHLVPVGNLSAGMHRLRLRLTQGLWRIDYLALGRLGEPVPVERLRPCSVRRNGGESQAALGALLDPNAVLITLPGDEYEISYTLPPDYSNYELFLESRGYYLEWMRDEWLAEEDAGKALEMFVNPEGALRRLAAQYKQTEGEIEPIFWQSRYAR